MDTGLSGSAPRLLTHPLDGDARWAQAIACDGPDENGHVTHHRDGLNILYSDGSVQFRTRDYLGILPDEPIVVGPTSSVELLRKMVVLPERIARVPGYGNVVVQPPQPVPPSPSPLAPRIVAVLLAGATLVVAAFGWRRGVFGPAGR